VKSLERVVFDCGVFFQALISPRGPAGNCFTAATDGGLVLIISRFVLTELRDVCLRPHLVRRFRLSESRVVAFVAQVEDVATLVEMVPHVFDYPRDPDDEHYVDLAVASHARLIVSRDNDLLALEDPGNENGLSFHQRFPDLTILTPEELLERISRRTIE
jgi:putative PIN family toxin of toxin-antitoxin system